MNSTDTDACEIEIDMGDGVVRSFWIRPVSKEVLAAPNVVGAGIAAAMEKPYEWGCAFMFGDLALAMELWISIAGLSGLDG